VRTQVVDSDVRVLTEPDGSDGGTCGKLSEFGKIRQQPCRIMPEIRCSESGPEVAGNDPA
ncbi:unnamed protein product, partial [Didymodactylos carnosus]